MTNSKKRGDRVDEAISVPFLLSRDALFARYGLSCRG